MAGYTVKNSYSGSVYVQAETLSSARRFCEQHLLKVSKDRTQFLSDLAAGIIEVYDARYCSGYHNPGF